MAQRKIAILGGGAGALSAAFQMTEDPDWKNKYDITVYQLGWRLGGKGASGRNLAPTNEIEEHGLHIWFGFYQNAFRMIRKIYAEGAPLMPGSPFQVWTDAFQPQTKATLMEFVNGQWKGWPVDTPIHGGLPGDPDILELLASPPSPWGYVRRLLAWMEERYETVAPGLPKTRLDPKTIDALLKAAKTLPPALAAMTLPFFALATISPGSLLVLAEQLADLVTPEASDAFSTSYTFILELLQYFLDYWIQPSAHLSDELRRLAITFDLASAAIRGMIASGVIFSGFDVINNWDYAAWLKNHGAKYTDSVVVRNLYDGCFAYPGGDPNKPNLEAGTALHGQLRIMFDYRGAITYRMNAGMGDTMFAPLYLVLKRRGVKFQFFRRVKSLSLSADKKSIAAITLDVQAKLAGAAYDPLVTVKGLPCWPSEPRYEQLQNPDTIRQYNLESWYTPWHDQIGEERLQQARDFDDVVLGIPVGALPYICQEPIAASPAWQKMVANIQTVQTQGLQLWLHKSAQDLGWENGATLPPAKRAFVCGYTEPFDTYADMSHLIPRENWLPGDNVQQVAYFCNCLPHDASIPPPFTDPNFPARQLAHVQAWTTQFLNNDVTVLWPKGGTIANPVPLDPSLIRKVFLKANIDPPERYVLSTVGSSAFRLNPGDSGFANLYLAGDWTRTDLNGGCVEAAVMSGLAAALSIAAANSPGLAPAHLPVIAPTPLTGSADDIRHFWQALAESKLPPESEVIARNATITAEYMELYTGQRPLFKWAGLASYASHRVGLLLLGYDFVDQGNTIQILDHSSGVSVPFGLGHDLNLIRQMNNAVYADVAWAHLAYQSRGLAEVLAGLAGLPNHDLVVRGFQRIDQGSQMLANPRTASAGAALIWAGNQDLLDHEQSVILQPGYEQMQLGFGSVLSLVTSMDFNVTVLGYDPTLFTSFPLYMTTFGIAVLARTGFVPEIGNLEQRWFWILGAILPLWKRVDSTRSSELIAHGEAVLLQEGARADALRAKVSWPVEVRPA